MIVSIGLIALLLIAIGSLINWRIPVQELFEIENLRLTPSLIYPKEKNWVVNTDYDLSFSFIGGTKELIGELVSNNQDEIYELKY